MPALVGTAVGALTAGFVWTGASACSSPVEEVATPTEAGATYDAGARTMADASSSVPPMAAKPASL